MTACRACGLLRDRFEAYSIEADADADATLEALWNACLENWSDADRHEKFAARASVTSAYAPAARRYRDYLRERPNDPTATERLARITKMAEVALLSVRPSQVEDDGPKVYRGVIALLVVLLIGAVGFGIYAIVKKDETPNRRPPASRSVR